MKIPPLSYQQINELFDEYYCYDLQRTELKLLHHILLSRSINTWCAHLLLQLHLHIAVALISITI